MLIMLGLIAILLFLLQQASDTAVRQSAALLVETERAGELVEGRVRDFFSEADRILESFRDPKSLEALRKPGPALSSDLAERLALFDDISEVTFTWPEGQISVFTDLQGETRTSYVKGPKPSEHPTYATLVRPRFRGQRIWSDLHYAQNDREAEEETRRVVLTVQQAVLEGDELLGVLRVGRNTSQLDRVRELSEIPGWIFLSDRQGRLLTRLTPEVMLEEQDNSLRYPLGSAPSPVREALRLVKESDDDRFVKRLSGEEQNHIVTFRELPSSQDWLVGLVWSEDHFLAPILAVRKQMVVVTLLILCATAFMMIGLLRRIHRDLKRLSEASSGMKELNFEADEELYFIKETGDVGESLEGAKATLRAASKYVPLDLIKQLFSRNIQPELGGESRELTILFTDVVGFTTISEKLSTDELAERLSVYLEQMNGPIEKHEGEVLERIGDALLVVWNAPSLVDQHSLKACLAALACVESTRENEWKTRFGIHRDQVMLGHFGSRNRMNYGILGDGVNLASRVEGLNKYYGTTILVTGQVRDQCEGALLFRAIDRVAVKGRSEAVDLHELLGMEGAVDEERLAQKKTYEEALRLYFIGNFTEAGQLFFSLEKDRAAALLGERCERLANDPPLTWDGVFRADFK